MREKPESVDFPNAASQGAKIGSISQPSPTGNPATIGCVYSCTGAFSFALYVRRAPLDGRMGILLSFAPLEKEDMNFIKNNNWWWRRAHEAR